MGFPGALIGRMEIFLLRRHWPRTLSGSMIVLTTREQSNIHKFSAALRYVTDGSEIVVTCYHRGTHWYCNLLAHPEVFIEVKGRRWHAFASPLIDVKERRRAIELFRSQRRENFHKIFGVAADAPALELEEALEPYEFARITPLNW
jgi:hypothetical protein